LSIFVPLATVLDSRDTVLKNKPALLFVLQFEGEEGNEEGDRKLTWENIYCHSLNSTSTQVESDKFISGTTTTHSTTTPPHYNFKALPDNLGS
jgi:hypothetical protein